MVLPADRVEAYWPYAKPFIMAALERYKGEMSEQDLLQNLFMGKMQLWVAWDQECIGAAVTEIANYSEFDAIRIIAFGTPRLADWKDEFDRVLTKFAKHWRCKRIEMIGRKGWEKKLGFAKVDKIMMTREVDYG